MRKKTPYNYGREYNLMVYATMFSKGLGKKNDNKFFNQKTFFSHRKHSIVNEIFKVLKIEYNYFL